MRKIQFSKVFNWDQLNNLLSTLIGYDNRTCKVVTGKYTGNGAATQTIVVDVIPKVIIIFFRAGAVAHVQLWTDDLTLEIINITTATVFGDSRIDLDPNNKDRIVVKLTNLNTNAQLYRYIVWGE